MTKRFAALSLTLIIGACTHPMTITSSPTEAPAAVSSGQDLRLGFIATNGDPLTDAVIDEIRDQPGVQSIKKNWTLDGTSGGDVDYIVKLQRALDTRSAAQNFWITFPGFIVFAHASAGYKYAADINTRIAIFDANSQQLREFMVNAPYEFRFTSFPRGAGSSSGWYTPGWGLINLIIGGQFASNYDVRATPEFETLAQPSYKALVSAEVIRALSEISPTPGGEIAPNS